MDFDAILERALITTFIAVIVILAGFLCWAIGSLAMEMYRDGVFWWVVIVIAVAVAIAHQIVNRMESLDL